MISTNTICDARLVFVGKGKDSEIMNVLEAQASNLVKATSILRETLNNYSTLKENNSMLKALEHEGDNLAHKLFTIIDKAFVTPLDKEDISELTSTIDQVLDATYGSSDKLLLFNIQGPAPHMIELSRLLSKAAQGIYEALSKLNERGHEVLISHSKTISKCEHEADNIYRIAIAELFETSDPLEILKLKEIYETLEGALDRSRDVADVIEDIALKYR